MRAASGRFVGCRAAIQVGNMRIGTEKLASIRQPHWHRHLDVKRPTLSCDLRRVVRSQSAVCRLFAQVDFRREMRPIAFVDPGAFSSTNLPGVCHSCRLAGTVTILLGTPCIRRQAPGLTPTVPVKGGVKWLWSANPQTRAISIG